MARPASASIPDYPGDEIYAVTIQGESEGWCVRRRYLEPTGERAPREVLYDGSSIRVSIEGEYLGEGGGPRDDA
jgi:hypothetical protein